MVESVSDEVNDLRNDASNTLLPGPFAALVSLGAATTSLSLRLASFVGSAAISTARFGTLTGFELGRGALEAILTKAGLDVIETSSGPIGRAAAEGVIVNAINTLHYAITNATFLISAGFQLGTTGLGASVTVAQSLLNLLDAIFGDTDTSRALATIVAVVQREFATSSEGPDHQVTTKDIITGSISFVLLQRWSREKTQEQLEVDQVEQVLLDIVVLPQDRPSDTLIPFRPRTSPLYSPTETRPHSSMSMRPASFVAANGAGLPFDAISYNDGASFMSHHRAVPPLASSSALVTEEAFKSALLSQLCPGTTVRITSTVTSTNIVTVEIEGDATSYVQAPPGFELIGAEGSLSFGEDGQKLVFRGHDETTRSGDFQIEEIFSDNEDQDTTGMQRPSTDKRYDPLHVHEGSHTQDPTTQETQPLTLANQKRRRSRRGSTVERSPTRVAADASTFSSPRAEKRNNIKKALKERTPYKSLLDFWNGSSSRPQRLTVDDRARSSFRAAEKAHDTLRPLSTTATLARNNSGLTHTQNAESHSPSIDLNISRESGIRSGHKRRPSSIFTVESTGTELVLHGDAGESSSARIQCILRNGILPGQYPPAAFARNVNRFIRFAAAAYGDSFLRLTGSITTDSMQQPFHPEDMLDEHLKFSSYTGLPADTVLLSSYVDPQGGPNAAGQAETGLPLVHYISIDHQSQAVVVAFRGTLGFEDILTDLSASYDNLVWHGRRYKIHQGILASARRILTLHQGRAISAMRTALEQHEDYGLVLCGHSLGGAVASALGVLLSQKNPSTVRYASAFVTNGHPGIVPGLQITDEHTKVSSNETQQDLLPPGRPIHVYAYGPAATMCQTLQQDSKGLITTIINNMDYIPYLSLGTLRDMHSIAYTFKQDSNGAKAEVRRRVWQGMQDILRDRTGLSAFGGNWWEGRQPSSDHWPWAALQSVRSEMNAEKLVPPGEIFIVKTEPVLQRYAFVHDPSEDSKKSKKARTNRSSPSFRPASHITLHHVVDAAQRFAEIRFGSSMFADHLPARYEKVLGIFERGV